MCHVACCYGIVEASDVVAALECAYGCVYLALVEEIHCMLCYGVKLAFVYASESVGVLVDVLMCVVKFLLQRVYLGVVGVLHYLVGLIQAFQFGLLPLEFALCLPFSVGYELLFLLYEVLFVAQNDAQRNLAHVPFVHSLLVEHHHSLLAYHRLAQRHAQRHIVQCELELAAFLVAHGALCRSCRLHIDPSDDGVWLLAVVSVCHSALDRCLCVERECSHETKNNVCCFGGYVVVHIDVRLCRFVIGAMGALKEMV